MLGDRSRLDWWFGQSRDFDDRCEKNGHLAVPWMAEATLSLPHSQALMGGVSSVVSIKGQVSTSSIVKPSVCAKCRDHRAACDPSEKVMSTKQMYKQWI